MFDPKEYEINEQRYRFTYTALKLLLKFSPLKLNIHNLDDRTTRGSIFLFNHFTRFETFIPQYLLHDVAKIYCRSVADHQLFKEGDLLGDYLKSVGAIPNNLHNIMDYMVDEINAGHKLVIFPEGGMIKDRKVRDSEGRLSIYKREGGIKRKPHTGAAVIAIMNRMLRDLYLMARQKGDSRMVEFYSKRFPAFDNFEQIDSFAREPVELVPANITFYPMRRDENILENYVKRFSGVQSKRVLEELKIEGNIFLKQTDMDVRFGDPIKVTDYLGKGYPALLRLKYLADSLAVRKGVFSSIARGIVEKRFEGALSLWMRKCAERMRDDYMNAIYDLTTINLGHLTAHTLYDLNKKRPLGEFDISYLRSLLFMGICDLRRLEGVYFHSDINKREYVNFLLTGDESHLMKILERFEKAGLLELKDDISFTIGEKLEQDFPFDSIRLENPAQILDNEIQSVPKASESLDRLYKEEERLIMEEVALLLHRIAEKVFEKEEEKFSGPEYEEVNKDDKRTTSGEPFFYRTGKTFDERKGVLLIHGFSASPAEMKLLGDYLFEKGYEVFGMRLPGHGTSTADLRDRKKEEWLQEVKLSLALLSHYCPKIFVVGNSMGALLGLMSMPSSPVKVSGFVAIAPAFRIKDKRLPFVSYLDAAQRFYELFADLKTEWPYVAARPENPDINYSLLPYHGLYELHKVSKETQEFIEKLEIPTLFIQAEKEYTIDPEATYDAFERVPAEDKTLLKVDVDRHVLTLDKDLPVFGAISDFLERVG